MFFLVCLFALVPSCGPNPPPLSHCCRDTSTDNVKVIVEHPNGMEPYITTLTTKGEDHLVESDQGEGGYAYRVCFQSSQPTGRSTRVEVRVERTVGEYPAWFA